jgi:hypothetical protein
LSQETNANNKAILAVLKTTGYYFNE